MNYELAKRLKDNGFTQRRGCSACLNGYSFDCIKIGKTVDEQIEEDYVTRPSLLELIEACGGNKRYFRIEQNNNKWIATTPHLTLRLLIDEEGSTPEEAVAKLWLELNKLDK